MGAPWGTGSLPWALSVAMSCLALACGDSSGGTLGLEAGLRFGDASDVDDYYRLFKLVRVIRIFKLPRLLEANPIFRRLRTQYSSADQLLLSGLCFLLYICHLMGCLYIFIADYEMKSQPTEGSHNLPSSSPLPPGCPVPN